MDRIGNQLLNDSKVALEKASASGEKDERFRRRDLLSLLLKANMSTEVPENQRMSEKDVLAREFLPILHCLLFTRSITPEVPTFLVAGHETTRYARDFLLS